MKSAQISKYGSSEVIEINQNTSEPTVSSGKVLVIIKAAGVNPVDWKIREGGMQQIISLQFPSILGIDFSGVIKQIGEDLYPSDFKQGDEIYGQAGVISGGSGAFAEMALVNTGSIANKPKGLSHAEAAALPLVGVSAWKALMENIELSKDQKILIHGGAGGIGSIAIQLAKNLGAYVATTVSANDKQFVQELEADVVIDYKTQTFEDVLHEYDAVFDTVGGETYTRSFKVLKKGGIIVSMLEQPNSELMSRYGIKAIFQFTQVDRERLRKLAQWVDENNIRVNVEKKFSLEEAGKALDYQKDLHPRGKVVLAM
ncbi:MAG TPA: NADP-dependent oxidoreductase [Nitrososphaeraceae archaeon]|nr:NADP-dependent oxidoreductase [Nitrososphaeraceae archaeon]